jgi:hypothetical protein
MDCAKFRRPSSPPLNVIELGDRFGADPTRIVAELDRFHYGQAQAWDGSLYWTVLACHLKPPLRKGRGHGVEESFLKLQTLSSDSAPAWGLRVH